MRRAVFTTGLASVCASVCLASCTIVVENELDKRSATIEAGDGGDQSEADGSAQDPDGASPLGSDAGGGQDAATPGLADAGAADGASGPGTGQVELCIGYAHACGIDRANQIHCWGASAEDQTRIPTDRKYSRVACGDYHTCAIDTSGALVCAGRNRDGQRETAPGPFTAVAAGYGHTCALTADGKARCFGLNDSGQSTPPDETFRAIAAGRAFSCGLRASDGTVLCWGSGASGLTGTMAGTRFLSLTAAPSYLCGVTEGKEGHCWGDANYDPPPLGVVEKMAAGEYSGCALLPDGKVRCWYQGMSLEEEPGRAPFSDVAVGGTGRCFVPTQGAIVCQPEAESAIAPGPNDFP